MSRKKKRSGINALSQVDKNRFGFNIQKDLILLRSAVQANPWQLGKEKWKDIADDISEKFNATIKIRTAEDRIKLLLLKYKKQQLPTSTGTETEQSERGNLLEEIEKFVEEEAAAINVTYGAESQDDLLNPDILTFTTDELKEAEQNAKSSSKISKQERKQADVERDEVLKNDFAPEPSGSRRKRLKISFEDEMIKNKQEHDIQMEKEKLQLEKERLKLEQEKETRLTAENLRRDELASSQLQMQAQMLQLLTIVINKPN